VTEHEVLISMVTGLSGGIAGAFSLWLISSIAIRSFGWITFRKINLAGRGGSD
jgi:hypothetical protein